MSAGEGERNHYVDYVSEFVFRYARTAIQQFQQSSRAQNLLGGALLISTTHIIYSWLHRKINRHPPGPIGLPLLGNMLFAADLPKYASYLASNYGSVSMIYLGQQKFVFLSSIDTINQVFRDTNQALDRSRSDGNINKNIHLSDMNQSDFDVGSANAKYWITKRRQFQSVLLSRVNSSFLNQVINRSLKSHVFQSIDNCIEDGDGIWHFSPDVQYIVFNSIWNACFGTFLEFGSPEIRETMDCIQGVLNEVASELAIRYLGFIQLLPQFMITKIFPTKQVFGALFRKYLQQHLGYDESVFDINEHKWDSHFRLVSGDRANTNKSESQSHVAATLIAQHRHRLEKTVSIKTTTKTYVFSTLAAFFVAGVDTSLHTTEYGLVLLAKYPAVQQLVYEEVKRVFGDDIWMEEEDTRMIDLVSQLHYLRAFVQEVLRISSIVALGIPHYNNESDITVTGVHPKSGKAYNCRIPKGTVIISDIPSANRRDPYWTQRCRDGRGRTAMDVCLDLWLDDDNNGHFQLNRNKDKNMAFGTGKRDCAGKALALKNAYLLFAKLLMRYQFELVLQDDEGDEIKQEFEFIMVMKPKIPLRVKRRR